MSRIVMLNTSIGVPVIIDELLAEAIANEPNLENFFANLNIADLVKECAQNAAKALEEEEIAVITDTVCLPSSTALGQSVWTSQYDGRPILLGLINGVVKNGLGIMVGDDGKIEFAGYGGGDEDGTVVASRYAPQQRLSHSYSRAAIEELRDQFISVYTEEVLKGILGVIGYKVEVTRRVVVDQTGKKVMALVMEGVKS